jgi:hypothetical protein
LDEAWFSRVDVVAVRMDARKRVWKAERDGRRMSRLKIMDAAIMGAKCGF